MVIPLKVSEMWKYDFVSSVDSSFPSHDTISTNCVVCTTTKLSLEGVTVGDGNTKDWIFTDFFEAEYNQGVFVVVVGLVLLITHHLSLWPLLLLASQTTSLLTQLVSNLIAIGNKSLRGWLAGWFG